MKSKWQVTAGAFKDIAAITAENIGGTATPVKEQDGLLSGRQRAFQPGKQGITEDRSIALF